MSLRSEWLTKRQFFGDPTTQGDNLEGFYFANGTLQSAKVRALSRSYPQAIQGAFCPLFSFFVFFSLFFPPRRNAALDIVRCGERKSGLLVPR